MPGQAAVLPVPTPIRRDRMRRANLAGDLVDAAVVLGDNRVDEQACYLPLGYSGADGTKFGFALDS